MADGPLRRSTPGHTDGGPPVLPAHLEFALRLHRRMSADPTAPSCISPYSVAAALGLLATGARGDTRDELVALLAGDAGLAAHAELLRAAAELPRLGDEENAPQLSTSAALWADDGIEVTDDFRGTVAALPNGSVHTADFAGDPAGVRRTVNRHVAEQTHGLIEELLPEGVPAPSTVALLVTALYLRASWLQAFPAHATEPRDFHAPQGTRRVPTMSLTERLGHAHAGGWQAVGLGVRGGIRATVLLPDDELATAESTVDAETLGALLDGLEYTRVELSLPRFSLRLDASLTAALTALGAGTMFTDDADLTGISSAPLAVDEVLHSAVLRVDEAGVEGAAATAVAIRLTAAMPVAAEPLRVRVDRPFLVLLQHQETGAVYFLGRVTEP